MTALAKDLAQGLDISFEKRVVSLAQLKNSWRVILDSGEELEAETVILTAPLPQCTEILRQSKLEPDASLLKIQYSKAVVALIEVANVAAGLAGHEGYLEPKSELIFSIADQNLKRLSPVPALTVTLKPEASERLYESTDEEIIATISTELRRLDPGFMATTIQLKKWRYAQPLTRFEDYFFSPAPGLYLAGDAFGGASLNGAARSANALADFLSITPADQALK